MTLQDVGKPILLINMRREAHGRQVLLDQNTNHIKCWLSDVDWSTKLGQQTFNKKAIGKSSNHLPGLAALPQVRPQSGREAAEWIQPEMPRGRWSSDLVLKLEENNNGFRGYEDEEIIETWHDMICYDYYMIWHDDFLVKILFDALRWYWMLSPFI